MRRKIDAVLREWAEGGPSSPILLRGARRVGKTYAVKKLGGECFGEGRFAYCDFQTNLQQLEGIFGKTTDVERIVADLSLFLNMEIVKGKTLIAFDEVQLCEKALNSLRFFAESDYLVIATGSQLGITLRGRTLPFPSDVRHVYLRPLDFEEYLWARGREVMARGIRNSFARCDSFALHEDALALYREYTVVGGMPKAVRAWCETGDFTEVRRIQAEINDTYTADIALYAPASEAVAAQAVWRSIPKQLARETTRKFKYSDVRKGGRQSQYEGPLAWLEAADLVSINRQTNDTSAPMVARDDGSFFKVYLPDVGLMCFRSNLMPQAILDDELRKVLSPAFRGALAETYVMQALVANGIESFYWTPGTSAQAEVEFVVQNGMGQLVPIEVKSGDNVRSRSLLEYQRKSGAPVAVRVSAKNFGFENGVLSVPLYAAFCLDTAVLDGLAVG